MIFFPLDTKRGCNLIYNKGALSEPETLPQEGSFVWGFSESLPRQKYIYASLLFSGETVKDICPSSLSEEHSYYYDKLLAHYKSFKTAKVNLDENCFFDLVPESFLLGLYSTKEKILKHQIKSVAIPKDYEILSKIHEICVTISNQKLNGADKKVKYNMFGTKTGRLSTFKGSYPILNMKKDDRGLLKPNNDMFVELDYNGAEIRTLLYFSGEKQPDYDIHEFNKKTAVKGTETRQQVKERFFAWLYNPVSKDDTLEKIYNKNIYQKFYNSGIISTPFFRNLEVEEKKALNYLLQSTTSDLVLENTHKLLDLFQDKKTFVAFTMHDSVVLDFAKEDAHLIKESIDIFSNTRFGKYLTNIKMGKNFGDMREIDV